MWREGTRRKEKEENQFWGVGEEDREQRRVRREEREMKEKSEKIMKRGKDYEGRRERYKE